MQKTERNREATEQVILAAVDGLVREDGFENLGINAVAAKAGVSKMLIYRYFESMDGLVAAYIRQYDFWINFDQEFPGTEDLGGFIKEMFRRQIGNLRSNSALRKFYRWELTSDNPHVKLLREQREQKGVWLVRTVSDITGRPLEEVAALASMISAAISYLSLLEETCDVYNGIPIQEDKGWEIILSGIDSLTEKWIEQ
ncbi:TetR/AcrR family transcriptional regulator [uncultured Alistipes sp.]|jgi:transcriptional regulator|uniref:TetR/AcrR family transcriptional regulator n=1 Tax=uncultured Alistipes sp. TaxID=538949 RepID=UPI0025DCA7AD|nr:TetR/AcrR family transcriptional regulator [uncultured Alistipes sp.]